MLKICDDLWDTAARRRTNSEADFAHHKESQCLEAILYAPANTLDDLGVKAQAAAATNHELWDEPANDLDWDQHFVRELIEAVARLANKSIAFVEKPAA